MGKEGCVMLLDYNDEFRSRFRNVRPCYWQQYFSGQRFANGRSDHLIDFLKPCTLIQSKVDYHHVIPKTLTAPSLSKDMKKERRLGFRGHNHVSAQFRSCDDTLGRSKLCNLLHAALHSGICTYGTICPHRGGGGGRGKRSGQPLKLRLGQPRWRAFILKFSFPISKISGEDAHLLFSRHVKIYALVCTVIPPITNSGLCLRSLMTWGMLK